jgi:branched-subunit amino acid permease
VLYVAVLAVVVGFGLLAVRAARRRGPPRQSLTTTSLQAAALIALVRLSLFWGGLVLYIGHADWRQVAGYALLIVNAVVEMALATSLSRRQFGPPLLVAGLILVTSLALGFGWGWLRSRPPFRGAA